MYKQIPPFVLLYDWFTRTNQNINCTAAPIMPKRIVDITNNIKDLANEINKAEPYYSKRLHQLKNMLFDNFGRINPFVFGQVFEILQFLYNKNSYPENDIWHLVHPKIMAVSKDRYIDGYRAEAVENAYKEINSQVKKIFHKINPTTSPVPDGKDLMNKVFSSSNPMIEFCDRTTDSGQNIQLGYKEMLSGAMSALRNPTAHANLILEEDDALRQIIFASMLMYKIDEGVKYTGISKV